MNFLAIYQIAPTEKSPDLSWRVYEVALFRRTTYAYAFYNGGEQHGLQLCHDDLDTAKARAEKLAADHRSWPKGQKAIEWVRPPYAGANGVEGNSAGYKDPQWK